MAEAASMLELAFKQSAPDANSGFNNQENDEQLRNESLALRGTHTMSSRDVL